MSIVLDARTAIDHFPGIGRYVVNLAQAITRVAPDLDLTLLHDPAAASSRLTLPDLPRVACSVSPFSVRQQWHVPKQLRAANATLYHSPYYLMPYRPGVPTVLTCYDLIPLIYGEYFTATQRVIYRVTNQLALRAARSILAISEATKADLIRYFHVDPSRIVVTPLAADAHFTLQSSTAINAVREKYHLPENYMLYFGSNKPHKNLGRLVSAFSQTANSKQPSAVHLVIAGQWDARYAEARQLAFGNEHIHFIGTVSDDDLPALYSGAQLFVFPSLYEGFGLPVLEAMACGTPIITSNVSSLPEVAGEAAVLVEPTSVQSITAALDQVVSDRTLQARLRQRSLARAAQFTWEHTARETIDLYRSVTAAP